MRLSGFVTEPWLRASYAGWKRLATVVLSKNDGEAVRGWKLLKGLGIDCGFD